LPSDNEKIKVKSVTTLPGKCKKINYVLFLIVLSSADVKLFSEH